MSIKTRNFLFIFMFFCLTGALFAQNNDNQQKHRIAWTKDEYALRYEVIIEKEQNIGYSLVLREFTEEPYINFSLPPGNYRLRVIPYDFRNVPGEGTDWKTFKILAAPAAVPDTQVAQNDEEEPEEVIVVPPKPKFKDIYAAVSLEAKSYSPTGIIFGGGAAIGIDFFNKGISVNAFYAKDEDDFNYLEAAVSFRTYLTRVKTNTGFFLQADAGIIIFDRGSIGESSYNAPAMGISAGWRLPLGSVFYIEPVVRAGYPYLFGASVTAGFRFQF